MTDFTLLSHLSTTIATVQDQSTLLKTIIAELQPVFGFYDVGLFLVNEAEDYHVDLVAETPEISPSKVSYSLFEQQRHSIPHHGSVVAWVMQQITEAGQPVLLDFLDLMTRFPNYPQWEVMQPIGYRDCLTTVLRVRGETIGMFCLNSLQKDHFLPEQFSLFQAVANQVAIALRNILAQEEVLAQKQRVGQLLTISEAITEIKDRKQLLKTIYQRIKPIFPYDNCGLFVLTEDGQQHYELIDAETIGYDPAQVAIEQQHGAHARHPHPGSAVDIMMQQGPGLFLVEDLIGHAQMPIMYQAGLRQLISGPLTYGGEAIGMLCFNSKQEDFYTEQDLPLFAAIAEQLSVAVSNVLANEEVLQQKQRVEQLLTISQAITQIKDRKQLLKTIYQRIKPIFPHDAFGLFVLNENGQYHYELIDAETLNYYPPQVAIEEQYGAHHRYPHPGSPIENMMQQGPGLFMVEDFMDYPQIPIMYEAGLRQMIGGPLTYGGEAIGMLCFNSEQKDFYTEQDLPMFAAIAEQLSVAVSNVLANEEVLNEKAKVERLHFVSEVMTSIQRREQLTLAFDRIRTVFPFDSAGLFVLDEDGQHHYELLDSQTLKDDPVQQQLEQRFGRYAHFPHPNSPIEEMMQASRIALYDVPELLAPYPDYPQSEAIRQAGFRQLIAAPLRQGKEVIGLLNFNSKQADQYREADISFVQAVAEQMSTVVSNILSNEREREQRQFKETLLEITSAVAKTFDRDQLVAVVQEKLRNWFTFEDIGLFIFTEGKRSLEDFTVVDPHISPSVLNIALHEDGSSNQPIPFSEKSGMAYTMNHLQENDGVAIFNMQDFAQRFPAYQQSQTLQRLGYQDSLTALLRAGGKVLGFFCINSFHQNFHKSQFTLFQAIADQLAVAVANVLANEDIQRRERFKTLQVELMRIFELSYELKNNYQQAGRLLQAEIPYDLFVALRFETDSYQLQGGSYFYADQAGEGHWLRQQPLLEGEVTNKQLLQGWCQDVEEGVHYLNGKDFADCLPPHAPVREAYRQLGVRSGLLGRTVLNANSSLLIACFSYRPEAYGAVHQDLLHRLLPTRFIFRGFLRGKRFLLKTSVQLIYLFHFKLEMKRGHNV